MAKSHCLTVNVKINSCLHQDRLHNWQYLGGGGGGGGGEKLSCLGGEASPAPPSLDETLGGIPGIIAGNGLLDFVPL